MPNRPPPTTQPRPGPARRNRRPIRPTVPHPLGRPLRPPSAETASRPALQAEKLAIQTTHDQGRFPENPETVKKYRRQFDERWDHFKKKRPERYERFPALQRQWERGEFDEQTSQGD